MLEIDGGSALDVLWIVESLRPGDTKTGQLLYRDIKDQAKLLQPTLRIEFRTPASNVQMLAVLDEIACDTRAGASPMLHIECHGDQHGIQLSDDSCLDWGDLSAPLIAINRASALNLVVVLAACKGVYLIHTVERLSEAPFWAVIAPDKVVYDGPMLTAYLSFYTSFLKDLNGDTAVAALNGFAPHRQYHFISAQGIFVRGFVAYLREHSMGKGRRQRIEALVTEVRLNPIGDALTLKRIRTEVKAFLERDEQHFEERRRAFFYIDQYPANDARFACTFQFVVSQARQLNA